MLRDLQSEHVGQLVVVPGIITSASKSQIKASRLKMTCKNCGFEKVLTIHSGLGGVSMPRQCERGANPGMDRERCPLDPFEITPDGCSYVDHQVLKIQEAPDLVPTGEMPRSFVLTSDRYLVDKVSPGMRVTVVGVFSIVTRREVNASQKGQSNQAVRSSYLRVVGMQTAEGAAASGSALP